MTSVGRCNLLNLSCSSGKLIMEVQILLYSIHEVVVLRTNALLLSIFIDTHGLL